MSVIRKTPYIEGKISTLNATQLTQLKTLINTTSLGDHFYTLVDNTNSLQSHLANETSKIEGIRLELEKGLIRNGLLIHTQTMDLFLNYHHYQDMKIYVLDLTHATYREVEEYLTIEELRRILAVYGDAQESAWEQAIKEYVVQEGDTTQVGGDMEIDGDLQLNGGISAIKDEDGNTIIPDSVAGKMLVGGSDFVYHLQNVPQETTVEDNLTSTSTTNALSANMGNTLNTRLNNVEGRGRFLSVWNGSTGKPNDLPTDIATTTYTYKTGDYFIVGTAGVKMPTGTSVVAGTTIATFPSVDGSVTQTVNDTIVFNGSTWDLVHTTIPTVTFGSITGNVSDNTTLTTYISNAIASAITTAINGNY